MRLFGTLYLFFARRRGRLYAAVFALMAFCLVAFSSMEMDKSIEAMLPDGVSGAASDFRMLQKTPFARKLLVNLRVSGHGQLKESDRQALLEAAQRLEGLMLPPFFSRVVSGPGEQLKAGFLPWLIEALPNLVTEQDLDRLSRELNADGVTRRLQDSYTQLLSPQGWAVKGMIQRDPLALRELALEKFAALNMIPGMRIEGDRFVSADGKNALLIAETAVDMADSEAGRALLDHFEMLVAQSVPAQLEVSLVSAHRYTVANAEAIQEDLVLTLGATALALALIFLFFLRSLGAVAVFVLPLAVLSVATLAVALCFERVSAITLGFGAVLMGISVDFALHVYFALRSGSAQAQRVIEDIARPLLLGGLTTIGAFSVLLFSDLPGQRQLAVFSIAGILAALLFSLVLLPHILGGSGKARGQKAFSLPKGKGPWHRPVVLVCWAALMVLCSLQGMNLGFNGDLRALSITPADLQDAEEHLKQTWGNMRGSAMIFAEGETLQEALEVNEALFGALSRALPEAKLVSLAPLVPSLRAQQQSRELWQRFWHGAQGQKILQEMDVQGRTMGFSQTAFTPFLDSLRAEPLAVQIEDLRGQGLGEILDALVLQEEGKVRLLTLAPDGPELVGLFENASPVEGAHLVSQSRFRQQLSSAVGADFTRFIVSALLVVALLVTLLFRQPKKILCALLPVVSGLLFMFGVMGWWGLEFNLFNVVATILIIGLGVDYGIFMVCKLSEGYDHDTDRAILVSGLTTIAGFGALVLAGHPALHSIGVTVLLGISAAIPAALFVIPAIYLRGSR